MMYEINKKVFVIDFPGSNSLDYHAKTFSICGAMNNLIIVVIPFKYMHAADNISYPV